MAIQQADKLLKKHKDLHCAKVNSFALDLHIWWIIYCNLKKKKMFNPFSDSVQGLSLPPRVFFFLKILFYYYFLFVFERP